MAISCEPRHARGSQRADAAQSERGDRQPERPADDRQQQAFGEQLPDDSPVRGAERGPHRHLLAPPDRARQQQVGDVRAGDQQHEADGRHQHDQRSPHVADHLLAQRHDAEREAAVRRIDVRMTGAKARRQRGHLRLRLLERRAGPELRHDVVVLAAADLRRVGSERQRQQHLRIGDDAERGQRLLAQRERRLQHAHDLCRLAVEHDRPADHGRVAAEAALPGAVAENRHGRRRLRVLFRREQPAERGADAEHRQQVRGDPDGADTLGRAVAGQVGVGAERDGDLLEAPAAGLDVEVLGGREPVLGDAEPGRSVPQDRQAVRVLVGEGTQQQGARDAEDRRVRADAKGQRQDRRDRKSGRGGKGSDRVAEVRPHDRRFVRRRSAPPSSC